jgi:hypothetical protein
VVSQEKKKAILNRRLFVKTGIVGASILAISRVIEASQTSPEGATAPIGEEHALGTYKNFGTRHAEILLALSEAFIYSDTGATPTPSEAKILEKMDDYFSYLPARDVRDLKALLILMDLLPTIFGFGQFKGRRMVNLSVDERREYLQGWLRSKIRFRRMGLQVVKTIITLNYYCADESWKSIKYDGPWVGRIQMKPLDPPPLSFYKPD